MPRELVTIQVGQCGNQIGYKFWDLALKEHAAHNTTGMFDDSMSTFFRNVDTRYEDPVEIPVNDGKNAVKALKARCVVVDMEEGVLSNMLKNPLGTLFDERQFISDVSGAGNNWACGHHMYGSMYKENIIDKIRRATEFCSSLQSFMIMHSIGGGTGSGLGTYILSLLEDNFPGVYRFDTAIFPSEDDDVVMSPYNSVLALQQLTEHADCVLPIENQSLINLVEKQEQVNAPSRSRNHDYNRERKKHQEQAFDSMNSIAASVITNLTSSMRFEGSLNVDLNEITTNLVPFPKLHYLIPSLSPLNISKDQAVRSAPRSINQMFSNTFSKDYQLIEADPRHSTYLACGLLVRGNVEISDISRNIDRIKSDLKMVYWNSEGFKIGLCSVPPVSQPYSLLTLANNCSISGTFKKFRERFIKLYRRKVYLHHYTKYMESSGFDHALESLDDLISMYDDLNMKHEPPASPSKRFEIEL